MKENDSLPKRMKRKAIRFLVFAILALIALNALTARTTHTITNTTNNTDVDVSIFSDNQINIGNGLFGGSSNPIHNAQCVWLLDRDYSHQTGVCQIDEPVSVSIERR